MVAQATAVVHKIVHGQCGREHICWEQSWVQSEATAQLHMLACRHPPSHCVHVVGRFDDLDERADDLQEFVQRRVGLSNHVANDRVRFRDDGPLGLEEITGPHTSEESGDVLLLERCEDCRVVGAECDPRVERSLGGKGDTSWLHFGLCRLRAIDCRVLVLLAYCGLDEFGLWVLGLASLDVVEDGSEGVELSWRHRCEHVGSVAAEGGVHCA